ncbi:MAG TPA: histidine phosphatase family protein [Burkholderiaceae bacterium]|nr:histidine phosphatase family protein [Burkholderiaceae bacterium]
MKEATRIIAIRHGQTAWNAETRMQGQLDTALDARGRWQAQRLVQALAHEAIDVIVASDLSRAMHTAAPLAEARGLRVHSEPRLRERSFGVFQGFTYADIARHWPDESARWRARDASFAPPRGESLQHFYQRCVAIAQELAGRHAGRSIVWVTHGGVLDCLYRAATRVALDAPRTWTLDNASINRLMHGDQGLMLVGWGDTAHLDAAAADTLEA